MRPKKVHKAFLGQLVRRINKSRKKSHTKKGLKKYADALWIYSVALRLVKDWEG